MKDILSRSIQPLSEGRSNDGLNEIQDWTSTELLHSSSDEGSQIFIVRADRNEKFGTIYHIYIDGLKINNLHVSSGTQDHMPHSSVSEKTLNESVTTLAVERSSDLPAISEGYKI